MNEAETRAEHIDPALARAGWGVHAHSRIRREYVISPGRIEDHGRRGKVLKVDYVLEYRNHKLGVIEAKAWDEALTEGVAQAKNYAGKLGLRFTYASNGRGIYAIDMHTGVEGPIAAYPSPSQLWEMTFGVANATADAAAFAAEVWRDRFAAIPFEDKSGSHPGRYYQETAVERVLQAIGAGRQRLLLTLATGTGKTFIAFQIAWKLFQARWTLRRDGAGHTMARRPRILFLADRNILADQAYNAFSAFPEDALVRIAPNDIRKKGKVPKNGNLFFTIFQTFMSGPVVDGTPTPYFGDYPPDFFDLIVIDECHRGSAADDAAWRRILEYFSSATQIGLTATPKETKEVSNIDYFGEPLYLYSLKQGIDDGFLAPYKVVRITLDKDAEGWRPEIGKVDDHGNLIEDREYSETDFDRSLVLKQRTELVAAKVTEFLKATDRFAKTIVFCQNVDHAARMREALVNANADLAAADRRYVVQITGGSDDGKSHLDNFITPESRYPVIATTSQLMSTGVDAQTCKLIVLDKRIGSMTEFKQIIGRGTRIREDYEKLYFTILDFRRATALFADPDFDGDPVQIYEPDADASPVPPDDAPDNGTDDGTDDGFNGPDAGDAFDPESGAPIRKYVVGDVPVRVISQRIQYLDENGKLITQSLTDYTRLKLRSTYKSLEHFLTEWQGADRKQVLIEELKSKGVFFDELAEQVGKDYDAFDLVCHVAFDQKPLTRRERVYRVKKRNIFGKYSEIARAVLDQLLDKYAESGINSVESIEILRVDPLSKFGTAVEIVSAFGGKNNYLQAVNELEQALYEQAA